MALQPLPSEVDLLDVHCVFGQLGEVVAGDLDTPCRASFDHLRPTVASLLGA